MFARIIICLLVALTAVAAFRPVIASSRRSVALRMSDGADPMDAIRSRMAQDPNYDPMKDPQAMQALEGMIPNEMREFANAIERLKVAFTDATTGQNPIDDLDSLSTVAQSVKGADLISSPTSQWFKDGAIDEGYDEVKLKDYMRDVQNEFPDAPMVSDN